MERDFFSGVAEANGEASLGVALADGGDFSAAIIMRGSVDVDGGSDLELGGEWCGHGGDLVMGWDLGGFVRLNAESEIQEMLRDAFGTGGFRGGFKSGDFLRSEFIGEIENDPGLAGWLSFFVHGDCDYGHNLVPIRTKRNNKVAIWDILL